LDEVNVAEAKYLRDYGFDVVGIEGLNLRYDADIIRVTPDFITEFVCAVDRADADVIFVSCAALRTVAVLDEIERRTGKPVISSNQALLWHCLRLAGLEDRIANCGLLLREH
jgi:maleate isomerase